jgi:MFS family permease
VTADRGTPRLTLAAVLAGVQLLAVLDSLAAALALPQIAHDLDLGAAGTAWVLNATSVALAGGLLVAGRLGDLVGERPLFLSGTALLGVGATVAGAAPDAATLLTGRALIGLGAATAFPAALALTNASFPVEPLRSRAFAITAVAGAAGSLGGAVYGGVVTDALGWRWVFWLTVPVTALLWAAAWPLLPAPAGEVRPRRSLDLPGAVLGTAALGGLAAGVIGLGTASAGTAAVGLLALAGCAAVALLVHERRSADPLLPGAVVRSPRLLGGCAGMAAGSALWTAVVFVHAQDLQAAGWSAARAGLALLPGSVGIVVGGLLVVPRACRRFGSARVAMAGLAVAATCIAVLGGTADLPWPASALPVLVLLGAALSAIRAGLLEDALRDGDRDAGGVSAAVFETSAHVGGAVSVAAYSAAMATGGFGPAYLVAGGLGVLGLAGVTLGASSRARRSPPGGPAPPARRRPPPPRPARSRGRTTAARG